MFLLASTNPRFYSTASARSLAKLRLSGVLGLVLANYFVATSCARQASRAATQKRPWGSDELDSTGRLAYSFGQAEARIKNFGEDPQDHRRWTP